MKTQQVVVVNASSPKEAARELRSLFGPRLVWEFDEPAAAVVEQIRRKLFRAQSNPALYLDKIKAYEAMLRRWGQSSQTSQDLAQLILDHGDSRIDNPKYVGVMRQVPGQYVVFGYMFL